MITGEKINNNYHIPDTQVKQSIEQITWKVNNLMDTKVEHFGREILKHDTQIIKPGNFITDTKGEDQKRMVINIGNKLYFINLTEIE